METEKMTPEEVKAFVEKIGPRIQEVYGLENWKGKYTYPELADDFRAMVNIDVDYEIASIEIDPAKVESKEDLFDSLIHEWAHVLLWPYEHAIGGLMDLAGHSQKVLDTGTRLQRFADERAVSQLLRIFYNLGIEHLLIDEPEDEAAELLDFSEDLEDVIYQKGLPDWAGTRRVPAAPDPLDDDKGYTPSAPNFYPALVPVEPLKLGPATCGSVAGKEITELNNPRGLHIPVPMTPEQIEERNRHMTPPGSLLKN